MTIYSSYTYNQGGYGDFIRSLFAVYVFCKENNIEHKLYIPDHPLNQCLVCITSKLNYPIKKFIDCNPNSVLNELNKCKDNNYHIILHCNVFKFISFEKLKMFRTEFKNFLQLSSKINDRISYFKDDINNIDYTAIHIRCGDKFMECNSQSIHTDARVNPTAEILYNNLENVIQHLRDKYNLPIFIFTDVKTLRDKICDKYNLLSFNTEIHHVASNSDKDGAFIDTISEFELLGNAKIIVKLAYTGFAFWSAFINDVPLYIYQNNDFVLFENF